MAAERVGLSTPRDLAFHPEHPGMLWVVNTATNSVTIIDDATVDQPVANTRSGLASPHFLARASAIAFGAPGTLATAQEQDRVTQPTTPAAFMGPTLWTSDPATFNGDKDSHLDMLHNSPNSVGIAWEQGNVYWVVDGTHRSLTRYDFRRPHRLGGTDHTDGDVRRYAEGEVAYVPDVSSCAEWDRDVSRLLVADTGNNRVVEFDPQGATRGTAITPNYDGDSQYRYSGGTLSTLIDGGAAGLAAPSGLALSGRTLFITDNMQSRIYAFRRDGTQVDYLDLSSEVASGGLMGIDVASNGDLYVVDALSNRVLAIAPR